MKRWLLGAASAGALIFVAPAQAEWYYQGEKSAFGTQGTHMALGHNGLYAFGFRCDQDDVAGIFITPEDLDDASAEGLTFLAPKLLIRVDDRAVHEHFGVVESANGKLRVSVTVRPSLLEQVRDAKRRIAVAIRMSDRTFHEASFSARGSTSALRSFLANCDISEDPEGDSD